VNYLVATLHLGDDDEAEVLDSVTDGTDVSATFLDYSAGGNPTFRFEGTDAELAIVRQRVGADDA
jgi:hypothetical protein